MEDKIALLKKLAMDKSASTATTRWLGGILSPRKGVTNVNAVVDASKRLASNYRRAGLQAPNVRMIGRISGGQENTANVFVRGQSRFPGYGRVEIEKVPRPAGPEGILTSPQKHALQMKLQRKYQGNPNFLPSVVGKSSNPRAVEAEHIFTPAIKNYGRFGKRYNAAVDRGRAGKTTIFSRLRETGTLQKGGEKKLIKRFTNITDLKPDNFVKDPVTGRIVIGDFSPAQRGALGLINRAMIQAGEKIDPGLYLKGTTYEKGSKRLMGEGLKVVGKNKLRTAAALHDIKATSGSGGVMEKMKLGLIAATTNTRAADNIRGRFHIPPQAHADLMAIASSESAGRSLKNISKDISSKAVANRIITVGAQGLKKYQPRFIKKNLALLEKFKRENPDLIASIGNAKGLDNG